MIPAALVAVACLPVMLVGGQLFDSASFLPSLTGAVAAAALLAWFSARRVAAVAFLCVTGIVGGLAYGTVLAVASGASVGTAPRALRDGWPRLLSVTIPAHPTAVLLVPLGAILWVAAYLAVLLAARTTHPLAPAPPPLLGLAATLILVGRSGGSRDAQPLLAAVTIVLVLAAAVLRATPMESGTARASGFELAVVAVVAVVGTIVALVIPVGHRYDPRDHYHPPVDAVSQPDPLGQVRGTLETQPAKTVFTIRFATSTGTLPTIRVALAELGDFDGANWSDDSRFVLVDHTLPSAPGTPTTAVSQTAVRATVTLGSLTGHLLPTVGRASAISGVSWAGTAYDPVSGGLAATGALHPRDTYTLTADVATPTNAQLVKALPASGPAAEPYLTLPAGLPAGVRSAAQQITSSVSGSYAKLATLASYLNDESRFPYDLSASPGHSYGVIDRLLAGTSPGDQRGYAEQHATAFAVLARSLGFPTRVDVGYLLDKNQRKGDGTFTVTTRQAHAWPEVLFAGIGWVAFEPTDTSHLTQTLPAALLTATSGIGAGSAASASQLSPPIVTPQLDHSADQDTPGAFGDPGGFPLFWVILIVGVLLAAALGIVTAKTVRRAARRRRGGPARRVDGAWREVRERLGEHGVARTPAWSHREVVAATAAAPGLGAAAEPLRRLAALADQAMYSPRGVTDARAGEAWQHVDQVRRALRLVGGRRRQLRAALDVRAFLPVRAPVATLPEVALADRRLLRSPSGPVLAPAALLPHDELPTFVAAHGRWVG